MQKSYWQILTLSAIPISRTGRKQVAMALGCLHFSPTLTVLCRSYYTAQEEQLISF